MYPEWLTNPFPQYALLIAGLGCSLYLFLNVKREIHALRAKVQRERTALEAALARMRENMEELKTSLRSPEEPEAPTPAPVAEAPVPAKPSLNLSKRSQVLRMYRRGERPDNIAAALGVPQNEVDLLLKVHRAVINHF